MGILEVSGWDWDKVTHASGTRLKYWLINPEDKTRGLFKVPRDNTGEAWAEQIASDLGQLIDYSVVRSYLANFNGTLGTLSVNFNRLGEELFEGGDLISQRFMDFNRYSLVRYEFDLIIDILKEYDLDQSFLYVPVFDAFIGNQDRHCDNWGIIRSDQGYRLAPSYDNGASLGHLVTKNKIHEMMKNSDMLQGFIRRGYSLIGIPERKKPKHLDLLSYVYLMYDKSLVKHIEQLEKLTSRDVLNVIEKVPDIYMDEIYKEWVFRLVMARKDWLLHWKEGL